jgi:hypothetical protein
LGAVGGAAIVLYKVLRPTNTAPLAKAAAVVAVTDKALSQAVMDVIASLESSALWVAVVGLAYAAIVAGHSFYVAFREDSDADDRADPYHLRAPLLLLDEVVRRRRQLGTSGDDLRKFRATLHKPVKGQHIQCVPYVGYREPGVPDGGAGRKWSNHCGLVGKVIRRDGDNRGEPLISTMPESIQESQYYEILRDTWSYTTQDARTHAPMRLASIAVPITDGKERDGLRVIGVVYCDSSERELREFFDEEIVELCVLTAKAIADHVRFISSIGAGA